MLNGKTIVVGVSGGIAAYKAAGLVSALVREGAKVHVIMTKNALHFIGPLTFESLSSQKCLTDTFDRNFEFKVEHIELAKKADLFVIAPATADIIGKMANGIADDMLTTTLLAAACPILIAPAMNTAMYENPIVQDNIDRLRLYKIKVIEPASGRLACGDVGRGKMVEPDVILEHIIHEVAYEKDLLGKKVLVSAGPTREAIDPVRFISNHSSGKMGIEIARAAASRGAKTTLVIGQTTEALPKFADAVRVVSAKEMFEEIKARFEAQDIIIKAAAVADYRPKRIAEHKIKKGGEDALIELERTQDILGFLGEHKKKHQFLCGFSMETENLIENSSKKLYKKNLDMIVANNLREEGAGFRVDTNRATLITREMTKELGLMTKRELAHAILNEIISAI